MKKYNIRIFPNNDLPVSVDTGEINSQIFLLEYFSQHFSDCGFINLDSVNRTIIGDDNNIIEFYLLLDGEMKHFRYMFHETS
jgi:hypothetical protein